MPNEQLLNKFADLSSLKIERDKILSMFADIEDGIENLSKLGEKISLSKGIRETSSAFNEYKRSYEDLVKIKKDFTKATQDEIRAHQSNTEAILDEARASEKLSDEVTNIPIPEKTTAKKKAVADDPIKTTSTRGIKELTQEQALLNAQTKERNTLLQLQANLENSVAGSQEYAAAKAKLLQYQMSILSTNTEAGKKKFQELEAELLKFQEIASKKTTVSAPAFDVVARNDDLAKQKQEEEQASIDLAKQLEIEAEAQRQVTLADEESIREQEKLAGVKRDNERATVNKTDPSGIREQTEATQTQITTLEKYTGTIEQNQEQQLIYSQELSETSLQLKNLQKNTETSQKGTSEYNQKVIDLTSKQTQLKKSSSDLNKTIQNQLIMQDKSKGQLERLRAQYALLTQAIETMTEAELKSAPGQQLIAEAATVKTSVDKVEQATLRFKGNVGNYLGAIQTGATKAFSVIRNLAYILPGIGFAGIFQIIIDGATELVKAIITLGGANKGAAKAQEAFNNSLQESSEEIGKNVGQVKALYAITQDTTQSLITRKEATEQLVKINKDNNERTGEHTKLLVDQNGILKENDQAINTLTDSLIKQAKTKAFLGEIEKAYGELIKAQTKTITSSSTIAGDIIAGFGQGINAPIAILKHQADAYSKGVKNAEDYVKAIEDLFKKKLKTGELDLGGVFDDKGKDKQKKQLEDFAKDQDKILFDMKKNLLDHDIEEQKKIVDNDKNFYFDRIIALQNYTNLTNKLIDEQADFDISQVQKKRDDLLKKEKLTLKQRADIRKTASLEIEKIEQERDIKINENTEKSMDTYEKIFTSTFEKIKPKLKDFSKAFEDAANKINKSILNFSQNFIDEDKKMREEIDKLKEKIKELKQEFFLETLPSTFFTILNGFFDGQLNRLQDQIDKINMVKEAQISLVNTQNLTDQQRADKIKIIESTAAAEQEKLVRRQNEIKRRQAIAERAEKIFQITVSGIEGAQAINQQLFKAPIPLKPFWATQLALSIATTAAKIVAAAAVPIPKYFAGKNIPKDISAFRDIKKSIASTLPKDRYKGLAIVGDQGRELSYKPSTGEVEVFNKPTVTKVEEDQVILPNDKTEKVLKGAPKFFVGKNLSTLSNIVNNTSVLSSHSITSEMMKSVNLSSVKDKKETTEKIHIIKDNDDVIKELKEIKKRSRIIVINQAKIDTTAWYDYHMKH